jgi:hypothetical protein
MHASTPDGRRFMVVDGYGLTRVELPNKVKNDRKAMCSDQGALSLDAGGARALVWDDQWDQCTLLATADLERKAFDRFALSRARLSSDGTRVVSIDDTRVKVAPLDGGAPLFGSLPGPVDGAQALSFGRREQRRPRCFTQWALGEGDRVAVLREDGERVRLVIGKLIGAALEVAREVTLSIGGGGPLSLSIDARGSATLLLVERGIETVFGLRVGEDGRAEEFSFAGLTMPERRGDEWLSQVSESTVVQCDDAGKRSREWSIADAAHRGVGELIACGEGVYFVPPHRECVIELDKGAVISRKLPAKEASVRRYYTALFPRYDRAGAPFGVQFSLGRTSFWNKGQQVSGSFSVSVGDGSLGSHFVRSALFGESNDGDASALAPFSRGGTGGGGYSEALTRPIDDDAVRALFEVCDRERIWLAFGLQWLSGLYERKEGGGTGWVGELSGSPGELPAERALFRGVLAHLCDDSAPALSPRFESWRGPLAGDEVRAQLSRVADRSPWMPCRAFEAVAWMALRVLDPAEAADVLVWMLLDGSERQHTNSSDAERRALAALLAREPSLRERAVNAVQAHAPAPLEWGGDRRDALLAFLLGQQG